ncbi:alcohol dehydrogenase catalytic domain-containing protein [Streptomyces boncukensis]|uniref:Alcohol dehydrogenase catalytic domain-containing protein n=1 Tax=Streptomyces boncukensis TaxID=2711219 RepID=A0A6G4WQQ5_9ACTN|nr:alcohol dehydrogenase catalytic domain-containing protein [Streptomyces boncukensis]NGO66957.1 alcohol dehydrogenase catalytic domain-containing protein [Streptomyces boncukensis]
MSGPAHRQRGLLRRTGTSLVSARPAARALLEHHTGLRAARLAAAAADGLRERLRPTRGRMRALTAGPGGLAWREVPQPPPPGPRGASVRPIAAATCDMDRPLALGATPFPLPAHLGHECVAQVLEVGDEVTRVRPGDQVVVSFQVACGRCPSCAGGATGVCEEVPPCSMYGFGAMGGHWGGTFSEVVAVPYADAMLFRLPPGVSPLAASSVADGVCDGYRHLARHLPGLLDQDKDTEVLILAGLARRPLFSPSAALYAGLAARALGAREVRLCDSRPAVRERAAQLGMVPLAPRELGPRQRARLVIDRSCHRRGVPLALSLTRPEGVCASTGGLHRVARVPYLTSFGRRVTLQLGDSHNQAAVPRVLELIAAGELRPELVISRTAPFDDGVRALRAHVRGDAVKTVLVESR